MARVKKSISGTGKRRAEARKKKAQAEGLGEVCDVAHLPEGEMMGGALGLTPWRIAAALEVLRTEINLMAPQRSKLSDGAIGDAAHATRDSDHNPWVIDQGQGVVTAIDVTHDPVHCSGQQLADTFQLLKDPRIKYVIWNRQIMSSSISPWTWRPYKGTNPHNKHVHISVLPEKARYDSTQPWRISAA